MPEVPPVGSAGCVPDVAPPMPAIPPPPLAQSGSAAHCGWQTPSAMHEIPCGDPELVLPPQARSEDNVPIAIRVPLQRLRMFENLSTVAGTLTTSHSLPNRRIMQRSLIPSRAMVDPGK